MEVMSGHSKWSTIKHKKAVVDAKRGSVFTKLANAIAVSVREGGSGDPEFNFGLRLAVDKARAANMPKENIERAIDRGLGKGAGNQLVEFLMEGYAPGGAAIVVEVLTDNRNRAVTEVKIIFDKNGGRLGEPGSVLYLFERVGVVRYAGRLADEQQLALIDYEVREYGEGEVICTIGKEHEIHNYLKDNGFGDLEVSVEYRAKAEIEIQDDDKVLDLMSKLDDLDDVQGVYANFS